MSKNSLIRMKRGTKSSNPARNEVLMYGNDELNDYIKEISNYPILSLKEISSTGIFDRLFGYII